jgi:pimeloyl-ACP methyl ester carboxylesterase
VPALAKTPVQDLASGFISHVALKSLPFISAILTCCCGRHAEPVGDIRVRTLVISGEDDHVFPIHHSNQLANGISGAKHVVISGAGHNVFKEQALRFEEAVVEIQSFGSSMTASSGLVVRRKQICV